MTVTPTQTVTFTATYTDTPTFTPTVTFTATDTPVPLPYNLRVEVFNEAGERVAFLAETAVNTVIKDIYFMLNGKYTDTYNPAEGGLDILLPGVLTPEMQDEDTPVVFVWDGTTDGKQPVSNGSYYIRFSMKDEYGTTQTWVKNITVLRAEDYVRVTIYNTAGEMVRRIKTDSPADISISLRTPDTAVVGKDGNKVIISYAEGEYTEWDGKNADGVLVSSGLYEVLVEVNTEDGYKVWASKSITIINDTSDDILGEIKAYPNPVIMNYGPSDEVVFSWGNAVPGKMEIRIYNIAGELIKIAGADMAAGRLEWDLRTQSGQPASTGMYIALFYGVKYTGENEKKYTKVVLIAGNNVINQ